MSITRRLDVLGENDGAPIAVKTEVDDTTEPMKKRKHDVKTDWDDVQTYWDDGSNVHLAHKKKDNNPKTGAYKDEDHKKIDFLADLFSGLTLKSGDGLEKIHSDKNIDYMFWDDPNELVHIPRPLVALQRVVNYLNANEIISIVEELNEGMIPYARVNKGYKYILTDIDAYSKFAWARPVELKNACDITEAMADVLREGHIPTSLQTDKSKKFYNANFRALMKKHNITH
ncbi:hypothetical protein PR048_024912, partial [Dryococelus australis]